MITGTAQTFPPAARAWTRDFGPTAQQPTGIIKTMPASFFKEYGMRHFLRDFYFAPNEDPRNCFLFTLPGIPKYEVLHFYLVVGGRIRFRSNIAKYEGERVLAFSGGRTIHGNAWAWCCAPVVRPPFKIEMKGFRGFRYTEELWE